VHGLNLKKIEELLPEEVIAKFHPESNPPFFLWFRI
jgi:hypothetical protein